MFKHTQLVESNTKSHKHVLFSVRNLAVGGVLAVAIVIIIVCIVLFTGKSAPTINHIPTGSYKIGGTDVYVVGTSDSVILIMPDIYRMSVEVKQIADFYSQGGFTVVVVDYFNGDPRTNVSDPTWNNRHPANLSLALASSVIGELSSRGYSNLQVQGYCYGGRIGVSLSFANSIAIMRSVVVAHPSSLVNSDATLIATPIFFVMPASDNFNSMAPYFNTTLNTRGISSMFKIYPNTTHGFAVSVTNNPVQKQIAMNDSLSWFHKHSAMRK